jgi:hypothetical protein
MRAVNSSLWAAKRARSLAWAHSQQASPAAARCSQLAQLSIRQEKGEPAMDLNRNQYLLAGLVILLLGIQLRAVDTFVLNQRATTFFDNCMQEIKGRQVASASAMPTLMGSPVPVLKRVQPPKWLGFSFVSVGMVLVLYSLALKKPGG